MATVSMPISRQVRATRTAISPRLAIRIFFTGAPPSSGAGFDTEGTPAKQECGQLLHGGASEARVVEQREPLARRVEVHAHPEQQRFAAVDAEARERMVEVGIDPHRAPA